MKKESAQTDSFSIIIDFPALFIVYLLYVQRRKFMKEFFGIGGYTRTPEGAWSWQHITMVSFYMLVMIGLAIFLGLRNKNKDLKTKNKVLIWSAILIDGFELIKFIVIAIQDVKGLRLVLPLFLCSIQLITIPLAAFTKGRLKEICLDFVLVFGILGGVLGTVGATQNYNAYPVLGWDNIVSGITHSISGFASLYIIIAKMQSMKPINALWVFAIMFIFAVLAYIANVLIDYNYMFLMRGDGTPYDIIYNLVNGNKVLYPTIVVSLFAVYIAVYYGVYYLIVNRKQIFAKKQK